ncbi:MAG: ribose-5-phosphate isomerase RpiA [Anaerolineae bacterium]
MKSENEMKREAGEYAVRFVESGMVVGLGHGSTAIFAIRKIAALLESGALRDIVAVPCSLEVEQDARRLGIPLTSLDVHPRIDVTIDGADEVDPACNVIKGGGGALLREKIVAQATDREIIVVDASKLSQRLGTTWAVPVEVVPFGWRSQMAYLTSLGAGVTVRRGEDGSRFLTDQGNLILDCDFGPIADLEALDLALSRRAGIVEHGLFLGLVSDVIVAGPEGVEHRRAEDCVG